MKDWKVDNDCGMEDRYESFFISNENGENVCDVNIPEYAHLIASAPELLEACKDSLQWWLRDKLQDDGNDEHRVVWEKHRDKLKEVIIKAEG